MLDAARIMLAASNSSQHNPKIEQPTVFLDLVRLVTINPVGTVN